MSNTNLPVRFSDYFNISSEKLELMGIFDPFLNLDTPLFIDPLLLSISSHQEIRHARDTYENYLKEIIRLLKASDEKGDLAWRMAGKKIKFNEVKTTCLGYSNKSTSGSGTGKTLGIKILESASFIVKKGCENPDLFVALGLLEEGIGADRISDMTTNIIYADLLSFNEKVAKELNIETKKYNLGKYGERYLICNLLSKNLDPLILVPNDILRDLPIVKCPQDIYEAANINSNLRDKINDNLATLFKEGVDLNNLTCSEIECIIEMINQPSLKNAYNLVNDPKGLISWFNKARLIVSQHPLKIERRLTRDLNDLSSIVEQIIEQFRHIIEDLRGSEFLYDNNGKPFHERYTQFLFRCIALGYCKENDIDLNSEPNQGAGPVDFKFSHSNSLRIVLELKLSTNNKLEVGYKKQLPMYMKAEETVKGYYLVIELDGITEEKLNKLIDLKNDLLKNGQTAPEIIFIDGKRKYSASKPNVYKTAQFGSPL